MDFYKPRIVDKELKFRLNIFGAILITGPKGCGKTKTAKQFVKSLVEFQDEEKRASLLSVAETSPSLLFEQERPILFDERQDAPKMWGTIRKYCDDNPFEKGQFILTGSSSNSVKTPHTGTLRISELEMMPMSLYETDESNGLVSLKELFDNRSSFKQGKAKLGIKDLIHVICRGGWPEIFTVKTEEEKMFFAKELFNQTCKKDISAIDKVNRNVTFARAILKSISRNICTEAGKNTVFQDAYMNTGISESTFREYYDALERLYIVQDIEAWCPSIRSKSAIRAGKKRNLVDPSLAVAALDINEKYFYTDFKTLGFLFESLCIRDLKVYSRALDGHLSYYRDRYGLEADAVLHLEDGRYALIECKLGSDKIEEGAKHLNKLESLIKEYNEKEKFLKLRMPDLKIVITGSDYCYKREDGVYVIPISCLKD